MIGLGIAIEGIEGCRGVMLDETMMIGDHRETEICSRDAMIGIGADAEVEAIAMSSPCNRVGRAKALRQKRRNRLPT